MKVYTNLLALFCIAILLSSCDKIGYDRFETKSYHLKGNVKSVKEVAYEITHRSGRITKTKENRKTYYNFNNGKITDYEISDNSEKYLYSYSKNGKILHITSDVLKEYTPYFNDNEDLHREEYVQTDGFAYTINYEYNSAGNIISRLEKSNIQTKHYKYKYNSSEILENITITIGDNTEIIQQCDSLGNIISEDHYTLNPKKITQKYIYKYKYDDIGNWLLQTKYSNNKAILLTERVIDYYEISEPALTNIEKSHSNKSFFGGDYFKDLNYRLFGNFRLGDSPTSILMIILLVITALICIWTLNRYKHLAFSNFWGSATILPKSGYKMKKIWMYNKEPYLKVSFILFVSLICFLTSLIVIFVFGGITWGVFWIIKLLLLILILVGWILLIGGALIAWAGFSDDGGCGMIIGGIISALIGGSIVGAKDAIKEAGNSLVETGFEFMQTLNMFKWGVNLFVSYWDILLLVFVAPLLLFTCFAAAIILLDFIFISIEWIITKIYNIRRPCSVCGSTKEPYYLTPNTDKPHPVPLHPGVYGTFTHESPINRAKLPTMLLNGRWKLERKCSNCGAKLNSKMDKKDKRIGYGTDVHVGIVGHRSSGKSYLLYSGLYMLIDEYNNKFTQIEANNETSIKDKYRRISSREGIQTNDSDQYRAIQLIYKDILRPIPYHLFFYDVAGEKFNASSKSHQTAMEFYKNVQSIIFVIDPRMIDYTGIPISEYLRGWLSTQRLSNYDEKYNIGNTFTILKEILNKANRKSKKIDFSFVCVKNDLKYFEASNYNSANISSSEIENYLCNDMGLNNLVNSAKAEFRTVNFYSVSTYTNYKNELKNLFIETLKKQGVKL